jgi:sugar lactone lactonase YvrE
MKTSGFLGLLLFTVLATPGALAQGTPNPHIVNPTATPGVHPPDAPKLPYHFAAKPVAPNGQQFGNIASVALTPQGHLIVFNRNPQIMMVEYDGSGKFIRSFNPNIAINSHGMRIDRHGNIWVTDSFLNVVWKLNPKGEPVMMLGTRGEIGAWDDAKWNGMFNQPLDVNFDKDDNVYVVQGHGGTSPPPDCTYCATYKTSHPKPDQGSDPRVFKFDKTGKYLTSRALPHEDGTYPTIHTVIVTPKGEVWVSDRQRNTIKVLDTGLNPVRDIKEPNLISGMFVDAKGQIWMSAGMDGMIMSLDADGKMTGWLGQMGRTPDLNSDLIGEAHYLTVMPDQKTIYIADSINAKVIRLERN